MFDARQPETSSMTARYYKLVKSLRQSFPQPVSDRVHDAYFVFSIMRALDQVDAMKSISPVLGKQESLPARSRWKTSHGNWLTIFPGCLCGAIHEHRST
jgi:hypothetical protein